MTAYAIKSILDYIYISTISENKYSAKNKISGILNKEWNALKLEGFKCVKVEIKEVEK